MGGTVPRNSNSFCEEMSRDSLNTVIYRHLPTFTVIYRHFAQNNCGRGRAEGRGPQRSLGEAPGVPSVNNN